MDVITQALTSQTFVQSVALLLATAALTGLLVPWIKGKVDAKSHREQKKYEADLARQQKIIDAQATLLTDFADAAWGYHALLAQVTYYKLEGFYGLKGQQGQYDTAFQVYDQKSWEFLSRLRVQMSKAQSLTERETQDHLEMLFRELLDRDGDLSVMASRPDATAQEWQQLHTTIFWTLGAKIDGVLSRIAAEVELASSSTATQALPDRHAAQPQPLR